MEVVGTNPAPTKGLNVATWANVKDYLVSTYQCEPFQTDGLKMTFNVDDDRSQVILVQWAGQDAETAAWVEFQTPIGPLGSIDLTAALVRTGSFVLGGLSIMDGIVTVRACMPLENLDRNEIEDPLHLLLSIGDTLERELTGQDVY